MYPLHDSYEAPILDFIKRLNGHKALTVKTNATSTHIAGEFDIVFGALKSELKTSFESGKKFVIVTKIINAALAIE